MINLRENVSLLEFNTFGIDIKTKYFLEIDSEDKLQSFIQSDYNKDFPVLILGGGSNILLTKKFLGVTLYNQLKGIEFIKGETSVKNGETIMSCASGENWHEVVMLSLKLGLSGMENLSLIPGSVGAAPMQNIGAYGVEIKDVFHSLEAIHMINGHKKVFNLEECHFGYRESIFKMEEKGKWFITKVNFILSKESKINTSYGAILEVLKSNGIESPTAGDVSNAVISIRQSKLPDPKVIGNSGSFFKNPEISLEKFNVLKTKYKQMPFYNLPNEMVKIPAGWLIEKAGWKGAVFNNTGTHKDQALVLVNHGNATGKEVLRLAKKIQKSILEKFEISLEMEVNII